MSKPAHNEWHPDPGARWYVTRYTSRLGDHYGDDIWAENFKQATRHCELRGLGEVVDSFQHSNRKRFPYRTPSEMLRGIPSNWDWQDLIHCATHISHLAVSVGVLPCIELLDDESPPHELIHLWSMYQSSDDSRLHVRERSQLRQRLIEEFKVIERQIPGLRP